MKTSSCKAKGRRACAEARSTILTWFPELHPEDVRIASSGSNGEDLLLSPRARSILPISVECKNKEKLNIWSALTQARENAGSHHPVVMFTRNRAQIHVALSLESFLALVTKANPPASISISSDGEVGKLELEPGKLFHVPGRWVPG